MKKNIVIVLSLIIVIGVMSLVLIFMKTDEQNMNFTEDGGTKENKEVANMIMDKIVLLWRECRKQCKSK